jgi:hypothetical protein
MFGALALIGSVEAAIDPPAGRYVFVPPRNPIAST